MGKIPHGRTPDERREYAKRLKNLATSHYENGRWTVRSGETNVVLVEVWEKGGKVSIHPSRNRIFPVQDQRKRKLLHALATDPNKMSLFQSGAHARARRGLAPQPKSHPKSLAAPAWAREVDLIGYTFAKEIQFVGVGIGISIQDLQGLRGDRWSYPSIYYRNGHATIDHMKPGNIGWEYGRDWKCLFFGNVPRQHV